MTVMNFVLEKEFFEPRESERKEGEKGEVKVTSDFHMWDHWLLTRLRDNFRGLTDTVQAFRLFDQDRDTRIGPEDLRRGIENLNLRISKHAGFRKQAKFYGDMIGRGDDPEAVADLFGLPSEVEGIRKSGGGAQEPSFITLNTWPLVDSQLEAFLGRLDQDRDGKVSFRDFVLSCYVRDREHDEEVRTTTGMEPTIWFEADEQVWGNWRGPNVSFNRASSRRGLEASTKGAK